MSTYSASLFLGGPVGLTAIQEILQEPTLRVDTVILDPPHAHEDGASWDRIESTCAQHGIPITLHSKGALKNWQKQQQSDYLMAFGYRRMLGATIRTAVRECAIGTHFAPLPSYRGFAPLNWMILNGETRSAVTVFKLEEIVDSGDIIRSQTFPLYLHDTINTAYARALDVFRDVLADVLPNLGQAMQSAVPQDSTKATYTCARTPEDGHVNWTRSAVEIDRLVRATMPPFPGAYCFVKNRKVVLLDTKPIARSLFVGHVPGRVGNISDDGVLVLCGDGEAVLIRKVLVDGVVAPAHDVINSMRLTLT